MIKVNKHKLEVSGTEPELLAELSIIIKGLKEHDVSEAMLKDAMNLALMDEKDTNEYMKKRIKEEFNDLLDNLIN